MESKASSNGAFLSRKASCTLVRINEETPTLIHGNSSNMDGKTSSNRAFRGKKGCRTLVRINEDTPTLSPEMKTIDGRLKKNLGTSYRIAVTFIVISSA